MACCAAPVTLAAGCRYCATRAQCRAHEVDYVHGRTTHARKHDCVGSQRYADCPQCGARNTHAQTRPVGMHGNTLPGWGSQVADCVSATLKHLPPAFALAQLCHSCRCCVRCGSEYGACCRAVGWRTGTSHTGVLHGSDDNSDWTWHVPDLTATVESLECLRRLELAGTRRCCGCAWGTRPRLNDDVDVTGHADVSVSVLGAIGLASALQRCPSLTSVAVLCSPTNGTCAV